MKPNVRKETCERRSKIYSSLVGEREERRAFAKLSRKLLSATL